MAEELKDKEVVEPVTGSVAEPDVRDAAEAPKADAPQEPSIDADVLEEMLRNSRVNAVLAEVLKPYVETGRSYAGKYIDEPVGDGMRAYLGSGCADALTPVIYDPKQFELKQMEVTMPDGSKTSCEHLHYIGKETDGAKIEIPEGLGDITGMFAGTGIKSMPKIPSTVKKMDMAFMNCAALDDAAGPIPASVESMSFAFAGCKNMTKGPREVPFSVKTADYAFVDCCKMGNTPILNHGLQSMDGMFGHCSGLKKVPFIPATVKSSKYATYDCAGLDAQSDAKAAERMAKARAKYEKKISRPGFASRVGNGLSAVMQTVALSKMGYGVAAPFMAHMMRKNGTLGKDFQSGLGVALMGKNPMLGRMVMTNAQNNAVKKAAALEARVQKKMARWDAAHDVYLLGLKQTHTLVDKMSARGERDVKNGLFLTMSDMNSSQFNMLRESHGHASIYGQQEALLSSAGLTDADPGFRKSLGNWYKQQLANKTQYFNTVASELAQSGYTREQMAEAQANMGQMRSLMLEPLVTSMRTVQRNYQLFNDGDMRDIDRSLSRIWPGHTVFEGHMEAEHAARPTISFSEKTPVVSSEKGMEQPESGRKSSPEKAETVKPDAPRPEAPKAPVHTEAAPSTPAVNGTPNVDTKPAPEIKVESGSRGAEAAARFADVMHNAGTVPNKGHELGD